MDPPDPIEAAKRAAAIRAVADHFDPSARYIGIGSGSTIVYVVEAIKQLNHPSTASILFVPTGYQSRQVIYRAGLRDIKYDSLPPGHLIDVAFDGADEVDEDLNCIKGGGACLYQEKLVATSAKKFVCVADHRKLQPRLLSKWKTIPIEVEPLAANTVLLALERLGSQGPVLREGAIMKAGPIKTDQDNFIIDAPFTTLLLPADLPSGQQTQSKGSCVGGGVEGLGMPNGVAGRGKQGQWLVEELAREIKLIEGVLSVGLFCGVDGEEVLKQGGKTGGQKPVAAYFGMANGDVVIRRAGEAEALVEKSKED
jgi:ribose 5-phosphate isomerase A